jgi:hypothetical protein
MKCATPNCGRAVPWSGHRFCSDCIGTVLRTGQPPVLPLKFVPRWLANLQAKELSSGRAA